MFPEISKGSSVVPLINLNAQKTGQAENIFCLPGFVVYL
jgi:hypothetical protein